MKALSTLIALCFAFSATAQISQIEKQALIDFFYSTNGSQWNTVWDLEKPVTTWHGVEIKNNTVVGIEMGMNNLQGELPASIGSLKNLESLKLFFNQIGGSLPDELFELQNLKTLDLNNNFISGAISSAIANLKNLEELLLSSNNFTGMLPSEIGTLNQLNTLVVFDNHFFGDFPFAISNLENLNELVITKNDFNTESLQSSLAILRFKGTRIDYDDLFNLSSKTEFANLLIDDDN